MRLLIIILLIPFLSFGQLAFPGANGGGSNATGGRGGLVLKVTNLNPSGAGSFREALENPNPAYIVFDVSGVIEAPAVQTVTESGLTLSNISNKTILGQTAPQGGITLTGGKFRINTGTNIIMRYFRSRPILNKNKILDTSDDAHTSAFLYHGGDGIMLDHVSASFAQDKVLNMFGNDNRTTKNITVSNSLFADGNTMVTFGLNPGEDVGQVDDISFIFNLIGNAGNRTPNFSYNGYGEILNNIIHGGGSRFSNVYYDLKLNHVGNYYKRWSGAPVIANKHQSVGEPIPDIYTRENFYTGLLTGDPSEDNSGIWENFSSTDKLGTEFFVSTLNTRTVPNPSTILTPQAAYDKVIADVGANKYLDDNGNVANYIDDYDQSVIDNVINNIRVANGNPSNWVMPTLPSNTRNASFDTDNDGMADAWEIRTFGDLTKTAIGNDLDVNYDNIEMYANQVDTESISSTITLNELKAFPTAEGFGKNTTGGRGGVIVEVTNLNDSGPGSLREALLLTYPRIIVFRVGGTINVTGQNYMSIPSNGGNLTIAGETAPGGGIQVEGAELRLRGSNVIMRNIKWRPGDAIDGLDLDGIRITNDTATPLTNVIIDHVSIFWGSDEVVSIGGLTSSNFVSDITMQNCIIAENINGGKGLLLWRNANNVSVLKNYLVHNSERNIRSSTADATYEMNNNLIYSYRFGHQMTYENVFDMIGNVYVKNPSIALSFETARLEASENNSPGADILLTQGFINDNTLDGGSITISSGMEGQRVGSRIYNSGYELLQNSEVRDYILSDVGAVMFRDEADVRVINDLINLTGSFKTTSLEAGGHPVIANGTPYTDADGDGMDDSWESLHGVTLRSDIKATYTIGGKTIVNNANYTAMDIFLADRAGDFNRLVSEVVTPIGDVLPKRLRFRNGSNRVKVYLGTVKVN